MRAARTFILLLAIAICLPLSKAQAGIMRHDVPEQQYLDFAADPMFQSVGQIQADWDTGLVRGTGALISPEWFLTAGHVVLGNDDFGGGISEIRINFGLDADTPDQMVLGDQIHIYPGYTDAAPSGSGVDLALVHLVDPIFNMIPAEVYSGVDTRGTTMFMAGYGDYGTGDVGIVGYDGQKRGGSNVANAFGGESYYLGYQSQYWMALFDQPGLLSPEPLEWQTAPGDSGTPWFAYLDGRMQLVGINSFASSGYDYMSSSGAIRTSLYTDWIDEHTNPVPEPSTLAMMLGLLPFLMGFRRRFA